MFHFSTKTFIFLLKKLFLIDFIDYLTVFLGCQTK